MSGNALFASSYRAVMKRRGVVAAFALVGALVGLATPASAQSSYLVETTALLVTSSHRDFAGARSAALKVHEKLAAKFTDEAGAPSPSVGASSTWRNRHGELFFLDENGWNVGYPGQGSSDGKIHVSIEDSSEFPGLVPGFLVVVIASGEPSEIWRLARRANAAGIRAHVRYSRQVFAAASCRH